MKNLLKIILINMVVFSVLAFVVTSITLTEKCGSSVPDVAYAIRGYAKYGSSVLASKTVIATLDGVNEGEGFSDTTDSNGWYELDVSRCGNSSATEITFTVCTRTAAQTLTFSEGGTNTSANLTISSACPAEAAAAGGGGGGGGGAGAGAGGGGAAVPSKVNLDSKAEFATTGVTLKQTQGDTATFTIGGVGYTAEVTKLTSDSVTITIGGQSNVLKIGDTARFDVDGDGADEISVTLEGIDGGRAELVYKKLAEGGMLALLDMIRDFYAGTSPYTMMEMLDKIRAFYGG